MLGLCRPFSIKLCHLTIIFSTCFNLFTCRLPRNPNYARRDLDHKEMAQMDPDEYLQLNRNGNSRKNEEVAVRSLEKTMAKLGQDMGVEFPSLQTATEEELVYILVKYVQAARISNEKVYSSGTLNTYFNSLASVLSARKENPVDIKKDVRFGKVRDMLRVKSTESKALGRGPGCNAKMPLKAEHILQARNAGTIGRGNPKAVLTEVQLAVVAGFGCRPGRECYDITNGDLKYGHWNEEKGRYDSIKLSERLTKTRRGSNPGDKKELKPEIFAMDDHPETCYVRIIQYYQQKKRPEQLDEKAAFFLNPNNKAVRNPQAFQYWYIGTGLTGSVRMGEAQIQKLLKSALTNAGVDVEIEDYSAISVRKAMIQSGVNANVPPLHIKRLAGHKSDISQEHYVNSAGTHHLATSRAIHRRLHHPHTENRDYGEELQEVHAEQRRNSTGQRDLQEGNSAGTSSSNHPRERSHSSMSGSDSWDESIFR